MATAQLRRWAILLSAYNYDIEFLSSTALGNTDAFSRFPLPGESQLCPSKTRMYHLRQIESLPVTSLVIRRATQRDPILNKVKRYTQNGWPEHIPQVLRTYHPKVTELTVEEVCLLWGGRVIIPASLKEDVVAELHKEHMGVSKMKALARSHAWWAGLYKDLEALAKSCSSCAAMKQAPNKAPVHPWTWPTRPW